MVTRILALAGAAACVAALFPSCYAAGAASQYLRIISKARPVGEVLEDPSTEEKTRAFLLRCADIRAFAVKELGLKESKNYTTYVDPGRPYIADVVQACAELSFERHLWSYPFVGKLPYKGFFTRAEAEEEASGLRAAGKDAIVRPVEAFSTLGYLKDPLWSYMRSYPDANLADTVIHELTHATVFKKGAESFNEELASFVGERGALLYIETRRGADSPEAAAYRAERKASQAFRAYLSGTASRLEAVYRSSLDDEAKRARKAEIIAERALEWKAVGASMDPSGYYARFDMSGLNNAYLDLFRLYYGEESLYADACERLYGNDLGAFLRGADGIARRAKDPKLALKQALASP
jgi:predicted aminopeptidase